MSELFEEEDDLIDPADCVEKIVVDQEVTKLSHKDARIRLEKKLDEKRLRDELDDFIDY